jgi:NTE family protein
MCRQKTTLFILFLALTGLLWLPVQASETVNQSATGKRPKIGLVLGGGGARGAAHVGVLKVLEELRIPVDYVVGTSMGSIVGGLYASGRTSADIEHEMLAMDWNGVLEDDARREDRSFRRKRDDELYAFKAKLGANNGEIEIPLAFLRGQKLHLELSRLMLPVAGIVDFDRLPIPYRAVATDIETGKEFVMGSGNLATAIRASMAVPAVFDPVEIDGRLLVDGGIANNVPVSVAREMGAEVFIVVDVGSGLSTREEIKTAMDVTEQLANFLFTLNTEHQLQTLGEQDLLIRPSLGDISGGSFTRVGEAITLGEQATRDAIEPLRRYSLSPQQYAQYLAQRQHSSPTEPVVEFIRIDNQSAVDDELIARRITAKLGESLNVAQLEKDIAQVYGLDIFESVNYALVEEDNKTGLVVQAKEKRWGPGYLQFGLASSNDMNGNATSRIGLLYTLTEINALNGEWQSALQFGEEPSIATLVHQPLDALSHYFVSGEVGHAKQKVNLFDDDSNQTTSYRTSVTSLELGVGREIGTWGEIRLGYRRGSGSAEIDVGIPSPDIDIDRGEIFVRLSDDKFDSLYFPRSGHFGKLEYLQASEQYGASSDYTQWLFNYNHAFSWGANTVVGSFVAGLTDEDNAPIEGLFQLGGFFRLSGLKDEELTGQNVGLIKLVYMRQLEYSTFFQSYLGFSLEQGNVWQRSEDIGFNNTIKSASLFVGFDTPFGPLYIGYGQTDTDSSAAYIYLGPRFIF